MKKICLVFFALFLSGCSTVSLHDNSATLVPNVYSNLEADITVDISEKIEGEGKVTYLFGFIPLTTKTYSTTGIVYSGSGGSVNPLNLLLSMLPDTDLAKGEAAYNAVKNSNVDLIVDPVFEMTTTNFLIFKTQTAKVTGYKGTINGINQVKAK
tara:strand:- start:81 stop:542 length:462 start_codon:yes stop_codon:yes gene_type:complete